MWMRLGLVWFVFVWRGLLLRRRRSKRKRCYVNATSVLLKDRRVNCLAQASIKLTTHTVRWCIITVLFSVVLLVAVVCKIQHLLIHKPLHILSKGTGWFFRHNVVPFLVCLHFRFFFFLLISFGLIHPSIHPTNGPIAHTYRLLYPFDGEYFVGILRQKLSLFAKRKWKKWKNNWKLNSNNRL